MATPVANAVGLTGDPRVDGLLQGSAWMFSGPAVLTYSFNTNFDYTAQGTPVPAPGGDWSSNAPLQAAMELVLARWAAVANLNFAYSAADSGGFAFASSADMAIVLTGSDLQQTFTAVAVGFFPDPGYADATLADSGYTRLQYPRPEGDVLIDNHFSGFQSLQDGRFGLWALMHEVGHALGLKHPFDDGGNGRPTFTDGNAAQFDDERYTVMSYSGANNLGAGHAATPMPLDILAVQRLYGANTGFHAGDDRYQPVLDGAMRTIWDAGGTDTLDLGDVADPVTVDLRPGSLMELPSSTILGIAYGCAIENMVTGSGNDTLRGNEFANRIEAADGADYAQGDAGNDTLGGGAGNDTLAGGEGADSVTGAQGSDHLDGGPGDDTLRGGEQADTLFGGDGDDYLNAGKETDALDGGVGNDTLIGALGNDLLDGGDGLDTADYSASIDGVTVNLLVTAAQQVSEATGLDTLLRIENLVGSAFDDNLTGTSSQNALLGGLGNDTLSGDAGADSLDGADGNDSLSGGMNADTLLGGIGDDWLGGGQGTDSLAGGDGVDTLIGGLGTDLLIGGAGADRFVFRHVLDGSVNIDTLVDLQSGVDVVELSATIFSAFAGSTGLQIGLGRHLGYDAATGRLTYDDDGTGQAVVFAIVGVAGHPSTLGNDFLIVA